MHRMCNVGERTWLHTRAELKSNSPFRFSPPFAANFLTVDIRASFFFARLLWAHGPLVTVPGTLSESYGVSHFQEGGRDRGAKLLKQHFCAVL